MPPKPRTAGKGQAVPRLSRDENWSLQGMRSRLGFTGATDTHDSDITQVTVTTLTHALPPRAKLVARKSVPPGSTIFPSGDLRVLSITPFKPQALDIFFFFNILYLFNKK